jgi:hypothetical protein
VEVSLPAAQTIIAYAFRNCPNLTEVSLPVVVTIDEWAFAGTNLTVESLPAVTTTIGLGAFNGCHNLTAITVDPANTEFTADGGMLLNKAGTTLITYPSAAGDITLPAITAISEGAFYDCTSLTAVSLPAVVTIGERAFSQCTSLSAVSLPATPPPIEGPGYDRGIFSNTGSSGAITVRVPSGAVSAYTTAWYVNADTPANGNPGVYGTNHKAVLISDAAQ